MANPQKKQPPSEEAEQSPGTAKRDVPGPTTDSDLNDALEDSFPASDPINFAGSIAGKPSEEPRIAPVGTHPIGGAEIEDEDDKAKKRKS